MVKVADLPPFLRQSLNGLIIAGSVLLCSLLLMARLPGMELLGIAPHWILIWVVAWSVKRSIWEGAIAGLALGWIQDGLTSAQPSHVLSLVVVGVLTARLQKQKYIQEDFISVALIVFGMAIVAETITAIQYVFMGIRDLGDIWLDHQRIALTSAILSSLWAPALYYPLSRWWMFMNKEQ